MVDRNCKPGWCCWIMKNSEESISFRNFTSKATVSNSFYTQFHHQTWIVQAKQNRCYRHCQAHFIPILHYKSFHSRIMSWLKIYCDWFCMSSCRVVMTDGWNVYFALISFPFLTFGRYLLRPIPFPSFFTFSLVRSFNRKSYYTNHE